MVQLKVQNLVEIQLPSWCEIFCKIVTKLLSKIDQRKLLTIFQLIGIKIEILQPLTEHYQMNNHEVLYLVILH